MSTTRHGARREPGRGGPPGGGLPPLRHGGRPPEAPRRRRWPLLTALAVAALAFGGLCGYAVRDAGVQLTTTGPAQDARGVIGLGEPPVVSPGAAISNAVANAIGVRVPSLPLTPDRVLTAMEKKGGLT